MRFGLGIVPSESRGSRARYGDDGSEQGGGAESPRDVADGAAVRWRSGVAVA